MAYLTALEAFAVVMGIAYLLLAVRESLWCWYAAFAGTCAYLVVFWQADLVMESALQLYYLGMAGYGWWHWRGGATREDNASLAITTWSPRQHLLAIGAVVVLASISGALLSRYTNAALPLVDSFTTFGAVLTTWMVARKVLENWLYWFVIDGVSIALYIQRELYLTAGLFAVYVVIVVIGYRRWLAHYRAQAAPA